MKKNKNIPSDKLINTISEELKIVSDKSRLRIIILLSTIKQLSVNDIAEIVKISPSAVSHQLKILKKSKMVKFARKGKEIYYSLNKPNKSKSINFLLNNLK